MTELYKVRRNSYIRVGGCVPQGIVLLFDHVDGMYSYCTDKEGNVHHIAAWAEVEVVEGWDGIAATPAFTNIF